MRRIMKKNIKNRNQIFVIFCTLLETIWHEKFCHIVVEEANFLLKTKKDKFVFIEEPKPLQINR